MKKLTYEMIDNKAVGISSYLEYLIIIEALAEGIELKFNIFGDVFDNNSEWFGNLIELEQEDIMKQDLSNKELKQQDANYNKYLDNIIKEDRR